MYKARSTKSVTVQPAAWAVILKYAQDLLEEQGGEDPRLKKRISKIKANISAGIEFPYGVPNSMPASRREKG